jgi:class 3 adenylate cyclase
VLFADLVGFTALSEDEDPEAVREFLMAYFERASQVIDRYGGTVEKFIGDAVMAVWGTPTAHEDDAERAVRAALELTTMIGDLDETTQLRAAVMTGEAAVNPSAQGQGLVAGDLVNTSSRLQGVASPGQVLVDETTMVAAGRAVAFEPGGDVRLKGKSEPMRAWAALEVVAERGGGGRRDILEPPFVGRAEELRLLKDSLHAPGREGKARLVTVIGQAGLGKSRLAWELKKYSDGVTEDIYWHEGQSPAYGEGVAYWALVEMVRARCHIESQGDTETVRAKLAVTLDEYVAEADERTWIEPRLGALLGVAEAPAGGQEELFAAWRTFFERIAGQGTVALVFEDLHWADDSLFDFIEHLLEWASDHPIVVVCLARPELLERRPRWGTGLRASTTIHLEPLPDEAMADLLRGLAPGCPERTLQEIVQRAEGVPLYAVETARMLIDEGRLIRDGERYRLVDADAPLAMPASLQALVTARLDGLGQDERGLVQDASVLGKSFERAALAAVSGRDTARLDELLQRLTRKQVVAIESGRRAAEQSQYGFVQGLLRDVAYSTLSRRDRRARHLAAAGYFESLADEELVGLVANHYYDAYRAVPDGADGQASADSARMALRAAAERSIALHADRASLRFIDQALSVTDDPAERAQLQVMASEPAWASSASGLGERYIREAIDWYMDSDRQAEADAAIAKMAGFLLHTDHSEDLGHLLESRVVRLDDANAGPEAPQLLNQMARYYLFVRRPDDAIEPLDRGLAIAERLLLEPDIAELFATKSWALGLRGRHHESMLLAQGSLEIAERHGMVTTQLRARMNLSDLLIGSVPRRGFEVARTGVEMAQRIGHATWAAALAGNECFAALVLGEWSVPLAQVDELDVQEASVFGRLGLAGTAAVARAYLGQAGDPVPSPDDQDGDRTDVEQNRALLSAYAAWEGFASGSLERVDRLAAASALATASFGEAALALCQAVHATIWLGDRTRTEAAIERLTSHPWAGRVRATMIGQGRAALAAMDGQTAEAERGYRRSLEVWRRVDMKPDIAIAQMEMVLLLGDQLEDRSELVAECRAILTELGAASLLQRLEDVAPAAREMEVAT